MLRRLRSHSLLSAGVGSSLRGDGSCLVAPQAGGDVVGRLLLADQSRILWGAGNPLASNGPASHAQWLALGQDPLLDAVANSTPSFRREDALGTDLVRTHRSPQYDLHCRNVWCDYYDAKFKSQARRQRNAASGEVGTLRGLPALALDEADRPDTEWSRDTAFSGLSRLLNQCGIGPVTNMEQAELALLRCQPEAFAAYVAVAPGPYLLPLLPLPSPAGWVYDSDKQKDWAIRFQTARQAAQPSAAKLLEAAKSLSWPAIAERLSEAQAKVDAIRIKRWVRQLGARPWQQLNPEEKHRFCAAFVAQLHRGTVQGDLDGEDVSDTSTAWLQEHEDITVIATADAGAAGGLTLMDYWLTSVRLPALELEHILALERHRDLSARALQRAIENAGGLEALCAQLRESIHRSTLDARAAIVVPSMNSVWLAAHWGTFGAASVSVARVDGESSRIYIAGHASLARCKALAKLWYDLRPRSSALDFATPFRYRQSYIACCVAAGIDEMADLQFPILGRLDALACAEQDIAVVTKAALSALGRERRRALDAVRAMLSRDDVPITDAVVLKGSTGASAPSPGVTAEAEGAWPLGAPRTVSYRWDHKHLEALQLLPLTNLTYDDIERRRRLCESGAVEVSLWRLVPSGTDSGAASPDEAAAAALVAKEPALAAVQKHAVQLSALLATNQWVSLHPPPVEGGVSGAAGATDCWEFAAMLSDFAPLQRNRTIAVTVPRTVQGRPLPEGTYRLRLRAFDHDVNPRHLPQRCVETFTLPFRVHDALGDLERSFFGLPSSAPASSLPSCFPGEMLIGYFAHLRKNGPLDVPLRLEFEAGQHLTPKGEACRDAIHALLGDPGFNPTPATEGFTEAARSAEPAIRSHWEKYHPGADDAEWAGMRRAEVARALDGPEAMWWRRDGMLENPEGATYADAERRLRYTQEVVSVLSVEGSSAADSTETPLAACSLSGTGALERLNIDAAGVKLGNLSVKQILASVKVAMTDAHNRLNTLAAAKVGATEKSIRADLVLLSQRSLYGGKYGRTYMRCHAQALAELADPSSADKRAVERLEDVPADRYASADDPNLRRTLFNPAANRNRQNVDDLPLEHRSDWR